MSETTHPEGCFLLGQRDVTLADTERCLQFVVYRVPEYGIEMFPLQAKAPLTAIFSAAVTRD